MVLRRLWKDGWPSQSLFSCEGLSLEAKVLCRGVGRSGGHQLRGVVEGVGYGRTGFREGPRIGNGVGQGRADMEFLSAADHLGRAGGILVVVPDSHNNFESGIGPAQAAKNTVSASHGDRGHSGKEDEIGFLLGDS